MYQPRPLSWCPQCIDESHQLSSIMMYKHGFVRRSLFACLSSTHHRGDGDSDHHGGNRTSSSSGDRIEDQLAWITSTWLSRTLCMSCVTLILIVITLVPASPASPDSTTDASLYKWYGVGAAVSGSITLAAACIIRWSRRLQRLIREHERTTRAHRHQWHSRAFHWWLLALHHTKHTAHRASATFAIVHPRQQSQHKGDDDPGHDHATTALSFINDALYDKNLNRLIGEYMDDTIAAQYRAPTICTSPLLPLHVATSSYQYTNDGVMVTPFLRPLMAAVVSSLSEQQQQ